MRSAFAERGVALDPAAALALWTDHLRWATFVEGYSHAVEIAPEWPAEGARIVWESTPDGRGRVTEKVVERAPDRFATQVFDATLAGTQTLRVAPDGDGRARVRLDLDYELADPGPFKVAADFLFIRRALRDSLHRTLDRFAVEAEEEARLR